MASNKYNGETLPSDTIDALAAAVQRELDRIRFVIDSPRVNILGLAQQTRVPDKSAEGDLGYFAANVVGATAGIYQFRGGVWVYRV